MVNRKIVMWATILGFLSVILGAFGAHALKKVLTETQLISFETGVRYQMYHAFFLLAVASIPLLKDKQKNTLFILTVLGTLFFSGSIYLLSIQELINMKLSFLGPITPIGGSLLIVSWFLLFIYAFRGKKA